MDILIPDSWLRDFLKTNAKPQKIGEFLSLCGPSVEKVAKAGEDFVYSIEVTTNRVDSAGVYGIAREAAAILPQFGVKAALQLIKVKSAQPLKGSADYLKADVDQKLCPRFTAILIKNIKIKESPKHIRERLEKVGVRPINNVVDISNYLMHEFGQPTHIFDYDKIKGAQMTLRESREGEKVTTLDGKEYSLPGGDIIIEDAEGRIIDLAGIMGGQVSAVDQGTQNVLLFVQTYNPINIRKTSMRLAKRSEAASLFEKDLDPEQVEITIRRGIDLFVELCDGEPESEILDIYPNPFKGKHIQVEVSFINQRLGIDLPKEEIEKILTSLSFQVEGKGNDLVINVPSFRAKDINIPEDIVEEVARIYGYHKLPSVLSIEGVPIPPQNSEFNFENKVKGLLKGWGGVEIYTLSLVPKEKVTLTGPASWAIKIRNPLGSDSEYLRQSLAPSLVSAVKQNSGEKGPLHFFEMNNIYLPVRGKLPEERMLLSGVFANYSYRAAKGVLEALIDNVRASVDFAPEDARGFIPNHRLAIKHKKEEIGQFGTLEEEGLIYYEIDMQLLRKICFPGISYISIPKYPPQIEDIALIVPAKTYIGEVIESISKEKQVSSVELIDVYNNTKTFRVAYQSLTKTLTNKEVEKIRNKILQNLKNKFGIVLKSN